MARDWPADLWPTSFKGVPFWTRKADSEFGKRLQKDQFPEQDLPVFAYHFVLYDENAASEHSKRHFYCAD